VDYKLKRVYGEGVVDLTGGSMGELSYQQRKRLSSGSFVFPEKRAYPIHDLAHARNALARVSQHGTQSEKAAVRSAVYRKYPGLKKRKSMREHRQSAKRR
jgi:hypothetical protein